MKKVLAQVFLIMIIFNAPAQKDKTKSPVIQKFHIESKYTVMTGIVLSNISLGFGVYSVYNYQAQAYTLEINHNAQLQFLKDNLTNSTGDAVAIWQNDIDLENQSYDKKLKINKTKMEVNLILSSFFFFAGNLMVITGIKHMVVTPNGIGVAYNF